jgi:hypothetical protein
MQPHSSRAILPLAGECFYSLLIPLFAATLSRLKTILLKSFVPILITIKRTIIVTLASDQNITPEKLSPTARRMLQL